MPRDWRKSASHGGYFANRDGVGRGTGVERGIADLAGAQHGVVALPQLRALGLSDRAVQARADAGRLHRMHSGVYSVGHTLLTGRGHYMAAVLACGEGAVLSHRSAADLWGLRRTDRARIDVTALGQGGRARRGIEVHRTAWLADGDVTVEDGIPCTSVARTLMDLARVVHRRSLERACDQAEVLELFDLRAVDELLLRLRGHPGTARLRAVLGEHEIGATLTRSELEERFLALGEHAGLPRPRVNSTLMLEGQPHEVDFLWRSERLVVEVDGWAYHRSRWAQERDRRRDQLLSRAGWRRERFTWRQVTAEPDWVVSTLRLLLGG